MKKSANPDESQALKDRILHVWATLSERRTKSAIARALDIRARTWDRWLAGDTAPPRPRLLDMSLMLVSEEKVRFGGAHFRGVVNPEARAWEALVEMIAERGATLDGNVVGLLQAKGKMLRGGAASSPLLWRALEMSCWVEVGVRLSNFRRLDWEQRVAMLRQSARAERVCDPRVGWVNTLMPFDFIGRPPQYAGLARLRMEARGEGDVERPQGKRARVNRSSR